MIVITWAAAAVFVIWELVGTAPAVLNWIVLICLGLGLLLALIADDY